MHQKRDDDDDDDCRTVSFEVFAENMTKDTLFKLMGRQFGPVRHVRLPPAQSEQGMCVVTFESDYAANKAVGMSKRGSPIYYPHLDLKVDWGALEIFRGDRTRTLSRSTSRSSSVTAYNSNFPSSSASEISTPTDTPLTPRTLRSKHESSSLPLNPPAPEPPEFAQSELEAFDVKHKHALLAIEISRTRLDYAHQCVRAKRDAIKCQEDRTMVTVQSIEKSRARTSYLEAEIMKAETERSILAAKREETEKGITEGIEKKAALEVEIFQARKHNAFLEDLLANVDRRTETDKKAQALRLHEPNDRMDELVPLIEGTFMSDTMLAAFWRVHRIVSDTIEEPCVQAPPTHRILTKGDD